MIDVKTAVSRAIDYLRQLEGLVPAKGIRLEETEYDEKGRGTWLITLSAYEEPDISTGILGALASGKRTYKLFRVDALTGDVKAMKVRQLQPMD